MRLTAFVCEAGRLGLILGRYQKMVSAASLALTLSI